uniref:Uncharacterized protein n=1 Tax=Arundo donax TaxID=35708 RepID=A0A0A8YM67_ARUDO
MDLSTYLKLLQLKPPIITIQSLVHYASRQYFPCCSIITWRAAKQEQPISSTKIGMYIKVQMRMHAS